MQKAGTSWLHVNLGAHPRTWLPPVKELNYFSWIRGGGEPGVERFRRSVQAPKYRRLLIARLLADVRARAARDLLWDLRFFLGLRHDEWYLSLFPADGSALAGETSPGYAAIGASGVGHVRRLLPEAKIILVLRDPIDRGWSQAVMELVKIDGRSPESLSVPELQSFVSGAHSLRLGDYPVILRAWGQAYPEDQLFVGFFDDLRRDPRRFLICVQRFLGLDEPERVPPDCDRQVNRNIELSIPPPVERRLAELYLEPLRELTKLLDGPPHRWLARAEGVLAGSGRG